MSAKGSHGDFLSTYINTCPYMLDKTDSDNLLNLVLIA